MDEEIKKPEESELEKIKKERDEYLNGWKRAKADLINYQKDESKRLEEIVKFAGVGVVKDLILVLDSFDLALAAAKDADKGFALVKTQLEDALKKQGLERIAVPVGLPFDPATQEAIASVESAESPGTVVEEVGSGYALHGRVIRPARVKIAREQESNKA